MNTRSGFWLCNPEMQNEWENFASECTKSPEKNVVSDMWLSFLSSKGPSVEDEYFVNHSSSCVEVEDTYSLITETTVNPSDIKSDNDSSILTDVPLSASQQQQIDALVLELLDIFEMSTAPSIAEELKEELSSLSTRATQMLLTQIATQLSDQGAYNLCLSLSQSDESPWINVDSVLKFVLFPMACGDPPKAVGTEFVAGILHLASKFPSICVSCLLKPLFAIQSAAETQLELISRLIPTLPASDFMLLLRHFIGICKGPLQDWQLSVLNTLLVRLDLDESNTTVECILLNLIPVLSASATQFSSSESFGCLLLKVVSCLKSGVTQKVCAELSAIANQSNSFSKRAILNAIKALKS